MKTVYLNWRGPNGRETVDEFTRGKDAPHNIQLFLAYVRRMISEYHMAGIAVYRSSRPCSGWER